MAYARKEYDLRLVDINDPVRKQLNLGGTYQVLTAGTPVEQTIYANDKTATAASNPGTISGGQIRFFMDSSVTSVDIVIYTANGDAVFMQGVKPAGTVRNVVIDTNKREQLLILPLLFNSNVETDTGFTLVGPCLVTDIDLFVTALDAGETINIGLDGTTNNDPNGLIAAASLAALGYVALGGLLNGGTNIDYFDSIVYGDLLATFINGSDAVATNGGITRKSAYITEAETDANITYTCSDGTDVFYGYAILHLLKLPT